MARMFRDRVSNKQITYEKSEICISCMATFRKQSLNTDKNNNKENLWNDQRHRILPMSV